MKKDALIAYLNNNTLDPSGIYGYYEFDTGRKNFLYNNYYSGENFVLLSVTGLTSAGGVYYDGSETGYIYSKYGEHKDIPFRVTVDGNGVITSAYIDAGNVGGNVQGNVIGGVGTGLYYETPTAHIVSKDPRTEGDLAFVDVKTFPNYDYGTRYDLSPFVSIGPSTGVIASAFTTSLGSGHFDGNDCLKFSSGFLDDNWTIIVDYQTDKNFAPGKSKIFLTSYENWNLPSGFAVTIDDGNHINFEYRDTENQIQSFPTDIQLQKNSIVSISKDTENNSILFGYHDLTEERHNFSKLEVFYNKTDNLYFGGFKNNLYSNAGYTGFSGYVNEILFLKQSCNSEQLTELSHLFAITGYKSGYTGSVISYYPIVTGIDISTEVISYSGVIGFDLKSYIADGVTGYYPSGIISGIIETGAILYYDPVNSGQLETIVNYNEQFLYSISKKNQYAPYFVSFENEIETEDVVELYSFSIYDPLKTSNLKVNFSASPGKLYFNTGIFNTNFNLYENGVYQVSGKDYDYYSTRSVIDSNPYTSYGNSADEESFACSLPDSAYIVSGFDYVPSQGSNYTYSNFPLSLDTNTGYLLYLNGQKLTPGASFDYTIAGSTLTLNNAANNHETGVINIAGIRSGASRSYNNLYGTYPSSFFTFDAGYTLVDEMIFVNGQRLKRDFDYVKTSSGNLDLRNAKVGKKPFLIFSGESGFFNV